eukprot:Hpha_TRINITY_DN29723_c0_g1::TRINITY_DN29723_c0_g1_i1::g.2698::m.2698
MGAGCSAKRALPQLGFVDKITGEKDKKIERRRQIATYRQNVLKVLDQERLQGEMWTDCGVRGVLSFLECFPQPAVVWGEDGMIGAANPAALELFGHSGKTLRSHDPLSKILKFPDGANPVDLLPELVGREVSGCWGVDPDGTLHPTTVYTVPMEVDPWKLSNIEHAFLETIVYQDDMEAKKRIVDMLQSVARASTVRPPTAPPRAPLSPSLRSPKSSPKSSQGGGRGAEYRDRWVEQPDMNPLLLVSILSDPATEKSKNHLRSNTSLPMSPCSLRIPRLPFSSSPAPSFASLPPNASPRSGNSSGSESSGRTPRSGPQTPKIKKIKSPPASQNEGHISPPNRSTSPSRMISWNDSDNTNKGQKDSMDMSSGSPHPASLHGGMGQKYSSKDLGISMGDLGIALSPRPSGALRQTSQASLGGVAIAREETGSEPQSTPRGNTRKDEFATKDVLRMAAGTGELYMIIDTETGTVVRLSEALEHVMPNAVGMQSSSVVFTSEQERDVVSDPLGQIAAAMVGEQAWDQVLDIAARVLLHTIDGPAAATIVGGLAVTNSCAVLRVMPVKLTATRAVRFQRCGIAGGITDEVAAAYDVLYDAVVMVTSNGLVAHCNPAFESLFEVSVEDIAGKDICMVVPQRYHKLHAEGMLRIQSNKMQRRQLKRRRTVVGQKLESGVIFPLDISITESILGGGGREYYVALCMPLRPPPRAAQSARIAIQLLRAAGVSSDDWENDRILSVT